MIKPSARSSVVDISSSILDSSGRNFRSQPVFSRQSTQLKIRNFWRGKGNEVDHNSGSRMVRETPMMKFSGFGNKWQNTVSD